ncbi:MULTISPECIES: alpha/beta hydrolase [unclassified Curtobacterium]|uniref:alpha/beta hydrolase n=1 Tax=unclassified Curtobacterium TaxID=257496 RepID=UPI001048736A|nr:MULTISPECIES: alpha/beta hydrolase [unclassified Curtobacterium]TCL78068.1 alpha/beta hydrolase family protein [Curtobacterium sp. PhB128]TCL94793.1 alpha/beta hydrolase family protein [Curtobacterium sp. PhB138]
MLLIAAALLTASMHSLGVIEAPVAPSTHAATATVTVALVSERHAVPQPVMTGGQIDVDTVADAHGRAFLDDLGVLGAGDLRRAADDRRVVATAQDDPPAAAVVAQWWAGLGADEQGTLLVHAPSIIGNLEGVPYAVRDRANRSTLTTGLADPDTGAAHAAMLGQVRDSLRREPGDPQRFLITLDTRAAGRAAISIGDLDTAADVTVIVPGMFFTVTGQMADFTNTANDLASEQATLAPLAAGGSGDGTGVAVVAWMGYRTPDLSNIMSLSLADSGAQRLERTVDGLRQIRDGDQPRLNIVAHSYGSTTALMALASGRMSADTLTVLGSPGSDVRSAADLDVASDEVFVGVAHSDPIAGSGYYGTDPGGSSFGATVMNLAGGADALAAGDLFRRPVGHNDYLKPGTASLHDVALIGIGRGDLVREQVRRGSTGDDGVVGASVDMYLVRPQDLQPRD